MDFDKFLLSRIREVKVVLQHLDSPNTKLEIMLDPEKKVEEIMTRLAQVPSPPPQTDRALWNIVMYWKIPSRLICAGSKNRG
jgi:hypothetical protein